MNANELEAMRRRLKARQAAEGEDHPLMIALAVTSLALLGLVMCFL